MVVLLTQMVELQSKANVALEVSANKPATIVQQVAAPDESVGGPALSVNGRQKGNKKFWEVVKWLEDHPGDDKLTYRELSELTGVNHVTCGKAIAYFLDLHSEN